VGTGRRTIISLGLYDWRSQPFPFQAPNVEYLYCVTKYPALLEDLEMPEFEGSGFAGYSDHTAGTAAAMYAIARGARVIEKHYTLSPALQRSTELAHLGSMTMEDLLAIRRFADAVALLRATERSREAVRGA
jgi:sialic acid synthase SpsE